MLALDVKVVVVKEFSPFWLKYINIINMVR